MWTVATSLAIVLGLFFVVVYVSRRAGAGGPLSLPKEAFDVLGRAALAGRQQAQVVRFGDKLILLAVSATGVESLAEITSPEEVERVAGLCEQRQPGSVTQSFQQVLHQFSREKTASGFIGSEPDNGLPAEESVSEFEKLA
jgi:flagellar biogenesis protein FliO